MAAKKHPASAAPAGEAEAPNFEEALERLETVVEELESGALSLEESIARYEEGMTLSRRLTQTLDEAEKRIERLAENEGRPATEPMELGGDDEAEREDAAPRRTGRESSAREGAPAKRPAGGSGGMDELPF